MLNPGHLFGWWSSLIFTQNPVLRTEETIGTPLTDSHSDGKALFWRPFHNPSLGIIREVRKLGDFLLHKAGSECWLAELVSTQRTWLGTHINTDTHIVDGRRAGVQNVCDLHTSRAGAWKNSINKMNEGATVIMSLFPTLTSTRTQLRTRFIGTNVHKYAHARTNTHIHTHK